MCYACVHCQELLERAEVIGKRLQGLQWKKTEVPVVGCRLLRIPLVGEQHGAGVTIEGAYLIIIF